MDSKESVFSDDSVKKHTNTVIEITLSTSYSGHEDWVVNILVFNEESKVITCGNDKDVRVYDIKSGKCVKEFCYHKKPVHVSFHFQKGSSDTLEKKHLIKWKNSIFLSVGLDGRLLSYSLRKMKFLKVVYITPLREELYQMMKLDKDRILCTGSSGLLHILRYSRKDSLQKSHKILLKNHGRLDLGLDTKLIKSIKFKDCFYMNSLQRGNMGVVDVFRVNHKKNKITGVYNKHLGRFYDIDITLNNRKEELLVGGGDGREFHIYNVSRKTYFPTKVLLKDTIVSLKIFNYNSSMFIISGDYQHGNISMVEIEEDTKSAKLLMIKKIHQSGILSLDVIPTKRNFLRNEFNVYTCSFDNTSLMTNIKNLPVKRSLIIEDMRERMMDLLSNTFRSSGIMEDKITNKEKHIKLYQELKLRNFEMNLPKVLLIKL